MANETYYSLLGISESATAAEIKTAYLRLISEIHPDRIANATAYWHRQAEEKCKEINEAYAVLSSDAKRRLYDAQLASCRGYRATDNGTAAERSDPPPASYTQKRQTASSAPPQNDTRSDWRAFLVFLGFAGCLAIIVLLPSKGGSGNTSASQSEAQPIRSWRYTEKTDEMTGSIISRIACISSEEGSGELCTYTGYSSPAVVKIDLREPQILAEDLLQHNTVDCDIRMRADDKPVFEVCGALISSHSDSWHREFELDDRDGSDRRISIMAVLKTAKVIRVELRLSTGTQIFTFKPDKPLDRKWYCAVVRLCPLGMARHHWVEA